METVFLSQWEGETTLCEAGFNPCHSSHYEIMLIVSLAVLRRGIEIRKICVFTLEPKNQSSQLKISTDQLFLILVVNSTLQINYASEFLSFALNDQ